MQNLFRVNRTCVVSRRRRASASRRRLRRAGSGRRRRASDSEPPTPTAPARRADALADAGKGFGGGRSPPSSGRVSGRWEGGGATGGGRSPPPTGEGGSARHVRGRDADTTTDTGAGRGSQGGGVANSTPVILYGGWARRNCGGKCYRCNGLMVTSVNQAITNVTLAGGSEKGITFVNGIPQALPPPPPRRAA